MRRQKTVDLYTQTQAIFLLRLQRLVRLALTYDTDFNPTGRLLLDRAIDATYRDCIDYGCADAALPIMAAHRRRQWEGQK